MPEPWTVVLVKLLVLAVYCAVLYFSLKLFLKVWNSPLAPDKVQFLATWVGAVAATEAFAVVYPAGEELQQHERVGRSSSLTGVLLLALLLLNALYSGLREYLGREPWQHA